MLTFAALIVFIHLNCNAYLIIGGVILAGLMKQAIDYLILSIVGGITVVLFLLFGIWLINYANK